MQDVVQRVLLKQALVEAREAIVFEKALPQVSEGIIESLVIEETTNVARSGINNEQTQRAMVSFRDLNIDSVLSSLLHSIVQDHLNTFDEKLFDEILITLLH
jgi:hypothetical protein